MRVVGDRREQQEQRPAAAPSISRCWYRSIISCNKWQTVHSVHSSLCHHQVHREWLQAFNWHGMFPSYHSLPVSLHPIQSARRRNHNSLPDQRRRVQRVAIRAFLESTFLVGLITASGRQQGDDLKTSAIGLLYVSVRIYKGLDLNLGEEHRPTPSACACDCRFF